ncbi:MAG: alpha-L-fucosidase [Chitinophagaceae bacterium]|nr:alpha-L-fucosidase [Chitinophagaceae bacterium]
MKYFRLLVCIHLAFASACLVNGQSQSNASKKFDPTWSSIVSQYEVPAWYYIVSVAKHHNVFSMYNSYINPWNSVKMEPPRNIIGELPTAVKSNGLHVGLSSYRAGHWWFFEGGRNITGDLQDTAYYSLYGSARPYRKDLSTAEGKSFLQDWLARFNELVDTYHSELVYVDMVGSWFIGFQPYMQQFVAHCYNNAEERKSLVANNYNTDIPVKGAGVFDIERDVSDTARADFWQTDISFGAKSWSYIRNENFKSPKQLINELVDIVNKNATYLLNINPKADGTISL